MILVFVIGGFFLKVGIVGGYIVLISGWRKFLVVVYFVFLLMFVCRSYLRYWVMSFW